MTRNEKIAEYRKAGYTLKEIAAWFGISSTRVAQIIHNEAYIETYGCIYPLEPADKCVVCGAWVPDLHYGRHVAYGEHPNLIWETVCKKCCKWAEKTMGYYWRFH